MFKDMQMDQTHTGRFLLCRSITPCTMTGSIHTMVEDTEGITCGLSIYNFPTGFEASLRYLDLLFPTGVILVVREPFLKLGANDGHPMVRVDSPTDILFPAPQSEVLKGITWGTGPNVPASPSMPVDAETWKARGNVYFKSSHWLPAAFSYSRGLECDPDASALRLNRAEAYLRLEFYSGAAADAKHVREVPGLPPAFFCKALFRQARAEYGRGMYKHAESLFSQWQQLHPENSNDAGWIHRTHERLEEQTSGLYNWARLFRDSLCKESPEAADFVGAVEVKQIMGRGGGRGMVAVKDIELGELLIVSKPFSIVSSGRLRSDNITMALNTTRPYMESRTHVANLPQIAQTLYGNPDLHDLIFNLYAGPRHPLPPPKYPPSVSAPAAVEPLSPTVNIDIEHLQSILDCNAFTARPLRPDDPKQPDYKGHDLPSALYCLPSLLNHACAPNAHWYCIGDIMVIRALQPIRAGEEITISYMEQDKSYAARRRNLKEYRNIDMCDCQLCKDDRADGGENLTRRDRLLSEIPDPGQDLLSRSLEELRSWEQRLLATYTKATPIYHPVLWRLRHAIAEHLRAAGMLKEAIEGDIKALSSMGCVVVDRNGAGKRSKNVNKLGVKTDRLPCLLNIEAQTSLMLRICQDYMLMSNAPQAKRWINTAQWALKTAIGADEAFFMLFEKHVLEQFGLTELARSVQAK